MYDPNERSHVVQMNLGLLTAIGLSPAAPEFPLDRVDTETARAMRERVGNRYALVNPGAAWPNKRWPAARYGAVARALDERHGLKTIVSWGPGEEALAQEVVREGAGAALLSPRTSIGDLVALIRGAALMISGDTGPTHVAAALGTPIVGIYGPTRPSRNGPWAPGDITISRDCVLPVPSSSPVYTRADVSVRRGDGRGAGRGRAAGWRPYDCGHRPPPGTAGVRASGRVVLWLAQPTRATLAIGTALAIGGECLRVWASGHLNKAREVTASGPYRWFAHPLYVGSSIMGVGLAIIVEPAGGRRH